jgi:hypothetical protein
VTIIAALLTSATASALRREMLMDVSFGDALNALLQHSRRQRPGREFFPSAIENLEFR